MSANKEDSLNSNLKVGDKVTIIISDWLPKKFAGQDLGGVFEVIRAYHDGSATVARSKDVPDFDHLPLMLSDLKPTQEVTPPPFKVGDVVRMSVDTDNAKILQKFKFETGDLVIYNVRNKELYGKVLEIEHAEYPYSSKVKGYKKAIPNENLFMYRKHTADKLSPEELLKLKTLKPGCKPKVGDLVVASRGSGGVSPVSYRGGTIHEVTNVGARNAERIRTKSLGNGTINGWSTRKFVLLSDVREPLGIKATNKTMMEERPMLVGDIVEYKGGGHYGKEFEIIYVESDGWITCDNKDGDRRLFTKDELTLLRRSGNPQLTEEERKQLDKLGENFEWKWTDPKIGDTIVAIKDSGGDLGVRIRRGAMYSITEVYDHRFEVRSLANDTLNGWNKKYFIPLGELTKLAIKAEVDMSPFKPEKKMKVSVKVFKEYGVDLSGAYLAKERKSRPKVMLLLGGFRE